GIDVLYMDLGRKIGVLLELIATVTKALRLVEVGDRRILLEALDDLGGLFRQRVTLVRGGVVRLVVAVGEDVDDCQDGDDDKNVGGRVCDVASLTCGKELGSGHLRTSTAGIPSSAR